GERSFGGFAETGFAGGVLELEERPADAARAVGEAEEIPFLLDARHAEFAPGPAGGVLQGCRDQPVAEHGGLVPHVGAEEGGDRSGAAGEEVEVARGVARGGLGEELPGRRAERLFVEETGDLERRVGETGPAAVGADAGGGRDLFRTVREG